MTSSPMNDGVALLLERMKTNPEEFAYNANEGSGKWTRLLANFKHCFTSEEITAVEEGIKNIERARFTELVMEELIDPVRKLTRAEKIPLPHNLVRKTPMQHTADELTNMVEHVDLHKKVLGLTPIAGVTQTL